MNDLPRWKQTKKSVKELTRNPFDLEQRHYLPVSTQQATYIVVRFLGFRLPKRGHELSLGKDLWITRDAKGYELRKY